MEQLRANPHFLGAVIGLFLYLGLFLLKKLLRFQLERINHRLTTRVDDVLIYSFAHTHQLFLLVCAGYVGFQFMPEHKIYPTWAWRVFFTMLMLQISVWGLYGIKKWLQLSFTRRRMRDPAAVSSISIVQLMLNFSFLSLVLIFTLHNLGIQVTTMIAGLGIGGIAIALAMQNILGDVFSSLSIILDKPFVVGDFIIVGEWLGEVEHIGLKTTRIRSLGGEQIIMSNSDLLGSRIRNMKRMHERRNNFFIGLTHESSASEVRRAVEIITAVVRAIEKIRFDRCHFFRVGTYSLDIEVVYFILSDDHNLHMDLQQTILLEIHEIFHRENISYAYPVQRTYMAGALQELVPFATTPSAPRDASSN